jgi:hypothetical protein
MHNYTETLSACGYGRALAVLVKKSDDDRKSSVAGFLAYRRRDGKKFFFVLGNDGKLHKTPARLPQSKRGTIPALAKAMRLGPEWRITLKDLKEQHERMERDNMREIRSAGPHMGKTSVVVDYRKADQADQDPDGLHIVF